MHLERAGGRRDEHILLKSWVFNAIGISTFTQHSGQSIHHVLQTPLSGDSGSAGIGRPLPRGAVSVLSFLFSSFPGEGHRGRLHGAGTCEQGRDLAGADFQPRSTARSMTRDLAKIVWLIRGRTRFLLRHRPNPVGRDLYVGGSHSAILTSGPWGAARGGCSRSVGQTPEGAAGVRQF